MKALYLILSLAVVAPAVSAAESMPNDTFRQMMLSIGALNYWNKAPSSLMFKCGAAYPDVSKSTQADLAKWNNDNAAINAKVGATLQKYVPYVSRHMGKTPDEFQLLTTRVVDEEVAQHFFNAVAEPKRHQLCGNFMQLLHAMLSDDLTKPRVNAALEDLPQYDNYLPKK